MANIDSVNLKIIKGHTILMISGDRFQNGFTGLECLPTENPKETTLEMLRKTGIKKAANLGVPFIDDTTKNIHA